MQQDKSDKDFLGKVFLPPLPPFVLVNLAELSRSPKTAVEDLLRRLNGDLSGLSGRVKVVMEMMHEAGHTICGGAIADYLRGMIELAGDIDVDVDVLGKEMNFYEASVRGREGESK